MLTKTIKKRFDSVEQDCSKQIMKMGLPNPEPEREKVVFLFNFEQSK